MKGKLEPTKAERNAEIAGLIASGSLTLESIGKFYGVSRERVRQIAVRAGRNERTKNRTPDVLRILRAVRDPHCRCFTNIVTMSGETHRNVQEALAALGLMAAVARLLRMRRRKPENSYYQPRTLTKGCQGPTSGRGHYGLLTRTILAYAATPEGACIHPIAKEVGTSAGSVSVSIAGMLKRGKLVRTHPGRNHDPAIFHTPAYAAALNAVPSIAPARCDVPQPTGRRAQPVP